LDLEHGPIRSNHAIIIEVPHDFEVRLIVEVRHEIAVLPSCAAGRERCAGAEASPAP
jgi:hypothetical protein